MSVMNASDRRIAALFSLVLASGLCIVLLAIRVRYPHGLEFRFLAWNLVLAWIPFLLAVALYDAARRGRSSSFLWLLGGAWLLFLPNAPYIVTDFVHVGRVSGRPGLVRRGHDRLVRRGRARPRAGVGASRPGCDRAPLRHPRGLGRARPDLPPLQRRHLHRARSPPQQLGRDHAAGQPAPRGRLPARGSTRASRDDGDAGRASPACSSSPISCSTPSRISGRTAAARPTAR